MQVTFCALELREKAVNFTLEQRVKEEEKEHIDHDEDGRIPVISFGRSCGAGHFSVMGQATNKKTYKAADEPWSNATL